VPGKTSDFSYSAFPIWLPRGVSFVGKWGDEQPRLLTRAVFWTIERTATVKEHHSNVDKNQLLISQSQRRPVRHGLLR
jgi:hypothetical protein